MNKKRCFASVASGSAPPWVEFFAGARPPAEPRRRRVGERGSSVVEVILLTVPLCLLSMVITSKMAATSSGLVRTQWQSSLAAQQGAVTVCGGSAKLSAPWLGQTATDTATQIHNQITSGGVVGGVISVPSSVQAATTAQQTAQSALSIRTIGDFASLVARISNVGTLVSGLGVGLSGLVTAIQTNQNFPVDILTQSGVAATNLATSSATLAPPAYYFKPLADQVMPDPSNAQLASQASFVCNEPLDGTTGYGGSGNKQSRLESIRLQLLGWTFNEATRFY